MKLNPDCIRDILLEVEKVSTHNFGLHIDLDVHNPLFDKYSWEELTYHIDHCVQSKLLSDAMIFETDGYADIYDLTPAGHEFLANIRQDTHWNKIKAKALNIGSFALPILQQIAGKYFSDKI